MNRIPEQYTPGGLSSRIHDSDTHDKVFTRRTEKRIAIKREMKVKVKTPRSNFNSPTSTGSPIQSPESHEVRVWCESQSKSATGGTQEFTFYSEYFLPLVLSLSSKTLHSKSLPWAALRSGTRRDVKPSRVVTL